MFGSPLVTVLGACLIITSMLVVLARTGRAAAWLYSLQSLVLVAVLASLGAVTGSTELFTWSATAFATNALLNPNINTVIYHIDVHDGGDGKIENAQLFGFLQPTTPVKNFMTFIFTKATSKSGGFNIFCTITGIDGPTMERLREKISSSPLDFLGADSPDADATAGGTSASVPTKAAGGSQPAA